VPQAEAAASFGGWVDVPGRSYGVSVRRSDPLRLAMHPGSPDHGSWRQWVTESPRPVAVDLFSGAGGLSQGLEAAGYRVVLAADTDDWALETHAHNFEGPALKLDLGAPSIRDALVELLGGLTIDLIAGGPPCQPFSRAGRSKIRSLVELGKRDREDPRQQLWDAFLDVVERVKPRAVLMENVPDMALGDDMAVVRIMMGRLEAIGYEVDARIVDAWLHGVPQHRQRLILVGTRGADFHWPTPTERVSLREAIADLPKLTVRADHRLGAEVMPYDGPLGDFSRQARKHSLGDDASVVYDHVTRAVRADDLEAFRLMRPGTLYSELPARLQRYRADIFDDKYNRLDWDDLCRSITAHIAKDGYWYIHPDQHRTLTVREAARIQTFPDHFRFAGARSHQFAQIGNAVPPALAESIGSALIAATRGELSRRNPDSVFRDAVRTALVRWAAEDRRGASWAYPADAWTALVGVIIGTKGDAGWPRPADVLDLIGSFEEASVGRLELIRTMADRGGRAKAVVRLTAAVAAIIDLGWEQGVTSCATGIGPSGRQWLELLVDQEGLVASSAVLRVTARLTNTGVDRQNRLSAGRMELAKLVGSGSQAPMLNAAMHRLGSTICTTESPACTGCPLRRVCRGRVD